MTTIDLSNPHIPDRLVRQAEAYLRDVDKAHREAQHRFSMINGLRVGADSVYAAACPRTDVACGYIGGDTPHAWSTAEWNSRPEQWRLPIFVRSYAGNGTSDGNQAKGWAQSMGMPAGAVIAYDLEQLVDASMVLAFQAAISPYTAMIYGAEAFVFGNPQLNAGFWVAAWNNSATLERNWSHQYASTNSYDLSVFRPDCPLWNTQGPTTPTPVVTDDDAVVAFTTQLLIGDLV